MRSPPAGRHGRNSGGPSWLLVRVLHPRAPRTGTAGTQSLLRRLLDSSGRLMGGGRTPHDLTGTRPRGLRRSLGLAIPGPYRNPAGTLTGTALRGLSDPRQHHHHVDHSAGDLPTARTPTGRRAPRLLRRLQAPGNRPSTRHSSGKLIRGLGCYRSRQRVTLTPTWPRTRHL